MQSVKYNLNQKSKKHVYSSIMWMQYTEHLRRKKYAEQEKQEDKSSSQKVEVEQEIKSLDSRKDQR